MYNEGCQEIKSTQTRRVRAEVWVEREPSTKGTHLR